MIQLEAVSCKRVSNNTKLAKTRPVKTSSFSVAESNVFLKKSQVCVQRYGGTSLKRRHEFVENKSRYCSLNAVELSKNCCKPVLDNAEN